MRRYWAWPDWRGYPTVTVTQGTDPQHQTVTKTIYHRSMSGDAKKNTDGTQVLYGQRPEFTIEPLEAGSQMAVGLAGGGTNTAGGQSLAANGSGAADPTPLTVAPCFGSASQQWLRFSPSPGVQYLQNTATGKCLDIEAYGTANGASIRLWSCTQATNQRWMRQPDGTLRNPASGRCLDIDSYNISGLGGAVPHLWDCTGTWSQVWMPTNRGELMLSQNARCAGATAAADGSSVVNQTCGLLDHNANQTWMLQPNGTVASWGYAGKCLDANGTTDGSPVRVWTCGTAASQQWQPQANGTLKNPASGRCLDAPPRPRGRPRPSRDSSAGTPPRVRTRARGRGSCPARRCRWRRSRCESQPLALHLIQSEHECEVQNPVTPGRRPAKDRQALRAAVGRRRAGCAVEPYKLSEANSPRLPSSALGTPCSGGTRSSWSSGTAARRCPCWTVRVRRAGRSGDPAA